MGGKSPWSLNGRRKSLLQSVVINRHKCAISELNTMEMEWVANHLGHSMDVEKAYYRVLSNVVENSKIVMLLMLTEAGLDSREAINMPLTSYNGKGLDDPVLKSRVLYLYMWFASVHYL